MRVVKESSHCLRRGGPSLRSARAQTSIETIILIVLVALAAVVTVHVLGTSLRKSYDCTRQSVDSGKGLAEQGCAGGDAGENAGGAAAAPDLRPAPILRRILEALGLSRPSQQGSAPATGSTPQLTPAQAAFADARNKLEKIPAGKQFLDYLDKNHIPVEFKQGPGAGYDKTNKKIILGEPFTADELLLKFLHEGNHAIFDIDGKTADPTTMSRDEYIAKMIEEETVGTVLPIEMARELAKAGHPVLATMPLETEYYAAYTKAVQDLQQANPNATPAQLDSAGRQAGLEAVKAGFENGIVVASIESDTGKFETYPDFYGHRWDRIVLGAGVP